jgi:AcrR family transcriptional regulator
MSTLAESNEDSAHWQQRVVHRSLNSATKRSIDRGASLIRAAARVLDRSNGDSLTVQDVADEAGQSLRTLYIYFASKDDLLLAVYEEAMRTYDRMLRKAIADIEDPFERLAGGIIASVRLTAVSNPGVDRGLSRLRLRLGEVEPELVARSQEPVTALFHELVRDVMKASGPVPISDEQATYCVSVLRTSYVITKTLGNDYGLDQPDPIGLASFCLGGLGVTQPRKWYDAVERRIRITPKKGASTIDGWLQA